MTSFQITINKITLKLLVETQHKEPTIQNLLKVPKVLSKRIRKLEYKTLCTNNG